MSLRSTFYLVTACILSLLLAVPGSVFAKDDKLALRIWGTISPFISGDAGSGSGAPDYDDAFDCGIGGG